MYIELIPKIFSETSTIIGKDRYLNSAVLIPVIMTEGREYLLFEKRSVSVRQPGEISFPGGHFDNTLDSDFMDTAIRETVEELGIQKNKITILGKLGTLVTPMGIIVETFVCKLDISSLEELNYDKKEVDKLFLVPLDFFINSEPEIYENQLQLHPYIVDENGEKIDLLPVKALGLPERYANPWKKGKHRVLVYRYENEIIWGITAELIFELVNRLRKLSE
ncbi:CoA pyrophosphatase [Ignavibacterium sp.]|uniref:NUDIX hydrolase n=1 Tax=Ignavibacterium sp. TaxID=2651167 RepID=UPI0021F94530|nr:CoA pyrophosphatase [Ignavibacterium sp.]BDQ01719.1 MAG: DNA mismatch repair protein MutT [Ignavibacterium sp.]